MRKRNRKREREREKDRETQQENISNNRQIDTAEQRERKKAGGKHLPRPGIEVGTYRSSV